MADTVLETERLVLRRWRESDLELWLAHLNTPQVRVHLGGPDPPEKVAEKFDRLQRAWDENGFSSLAVERRADRCFLGSCGLASIATEGAPLALRDSIQVGWQFRADCWGQGYATEAARAVLGMAFERFDLPAVYAQTSPPNHRSWRVIVRLGMERLAQLDYDDPRYPPEENPTIVYGLERVAWDAARQEPAAHA